MKLLARPLGFAVASILAASSSAWAGGDFVVNHRESATEMFAIDARTVTSFLETRVNQDSMTPVRIGNVDVRRRPVATAANTMIGVVSYLSGWRTLHDQYFVLKFDLVSEGATHSFTCDLTAIAGGFDGTAWSIEGCRSATATLKDIKPIRTRELGRPRATN